MIKRQRKNETIPYLGEKHAVLIGGRLRLVADLLNYGPATHAFYRHGAVWNIRVIEPMTNDELYDALEFTLATDLATLHLSELR